MMNYPRQCRLVLVHIQIFRKCHVLKRTLFLYSSNNISTLLSGSLLNDIVIMSNVNCNLNVNRITSQVPYVNTSTVSRDSAKFCHCLQYFRLINIFHHIENHAIISRQKNCSALHTTIAHETTALQTNLQGWSLQPERVILILGLGVWLQSVTSSSSSNQGLLYWSPWSCPVISALPPPAAAAAAAAAAAGRRWRTIGAVCG